MILPNLFIRYQKIWSHYHESSQDSYTFSIYLS